MNQTYLYIAYIQYKMKTAIDANTMFALIRVYCKQSSLEHDRF